MSISHVSFMICTVLYLNKCSGKSYQQTFLFPLTKRDRFCPELSVVVAREVGQALVSMFRSTKSYI